MLEPVKGRAPPELRRVLVLLTIASTIVVATEFIVAGLLPVLARDLHIALAEAGSFVGAFALSAAIIGPVLTLAATSTPPKVVLAGSLLVFAAGNVVAVMAPSYGTLLAVRLIQGALLPVFISVGTASVSALATPERRGRALALANTGFVIGTIVAVPAGVALTADGTWWPAFLSLALLGLVAAGLILASFPAVGGGREATLAGQAVLLRQPLFLGHLSLSVATFTAMFASYTYLAAWLEGVADLSSTGVALALAGFGSAGLAGHALATKLADRAPLRATLLVVVTIALTGVCLPVVYDSPLLLALLLGVWGAAHTAAVTLCQVRVTLAGGGAPAFAMSMNISSANLGIALGAIFGGWVIERVGVRAMGWSAASLVMVVAALARLTHTLGRTSIEQRWPDARQGEGTRVGGLKSDGHSVRQRPSQPSAAHQRTGPEAR